MIAFLHELWNDNVDRVQADGGLKHMKILVLTNFYPPHHIGGYGMLCMEVVNSLIARGHSVTVLSGKHGVACDTVEGHVQRRLTLESALYYYQPSSAWRYPFAKQGNFAVLRELIKKEQPALIFIWGMWALSKEVAQLAETLRPGRVVYYLANPWPSDPNLHQLYWDAPATTPLRRLAKRSMRLLARLWLHTEWQKTPLAFEHALCCSAALREQLLAAGIPLKQAPVIYEGIELAPYLVQQPYQRLEQNGNGSRLAANQIQPFYALLFVGTLSEAKGVHTTIEALASLCPTVRRHFQLTIVGSGHPHYEARLHRLVATHNLAAWVTFHQPIARSALPALLGQYQVLLLPSIWEEPLARIMQEGLAAGLVVIGAATGGTKETIRHDKNGLLFPAADAAALAACLRRLVTDPTVAPRVATAGRQTAIEKFALPRMVDEIERYLVKLNASPISI